MGRGASGGRPTTSRWSSSRCCRSRREAQCPSRRFTARSDRALRALVGSSSLLVVAGVQTASRLTAARCSAALSAFGSSRVHAPSGNHERCNGRCSFRELSYDFLVHLNPRALEARQRGGSFNDERKASGRRDGPEAGALRGVDGGAPRWHAAAVRRRVGRDDERDATERHDGPHPLRAGTRIPWCSSGGCSRSGRPAAPTARTSSSRQSGAWSRPSAASDAGRARRARAARRGAR